MDRRIEPRRTAQRDSGTGDDLTGDRVIDDASRIHGQALLGDTLVGREPKSGQCSAARIRAARVVGANDSWCTRQSTLIRDRRSVENAVGGLSELDFIAAAGRHGTELIGAIGVRGRGLHQQRGLVELNRPAGQHYLIASANAVVVGIAPDGTCNARGCTLFTKQVADCVGRRTEVNCTDNIITQRTARSTYGIKAVRVPRGLSFSE